MEDRTNLNTNAEIAKKVTTSGSYNASVITYMPSIEGKRDGWIYLDKPEGGYIDKSKRLVNLEKLNDHRKLVAASGKGLTQGEVYSDLYQNILEEAKTQKEQIDANPYIRPTELVSAAATGNNLIDTAYETVRRVNYLDGVVSKQYILAKYNALNVVNVRNVSVLNVVGFKKTSDLLTGIPEIGDHTTPPPVTETYSTYTKSIYADSFRYEFGMREKKDSAVDLEGQVVSQIPAIFAKMKDDKITTLINAASGTAVSTDWDAKGSTAGFYDTDAVRDIEADEDALQSYGGDLNMICNHAVISGYFLNIRNVGVGSPQGTLGSLSNTYSGTLPLNAAVPFYINSSITAKAYAVIVKQSWADFLRGAVMNVSYKNSLSPAQTEGRILFDFNGVVEKDSGAIRFRTGAIA